MLNSIKARLEKCETWKQPHKDISRLVTEIERLRAEDDIWDKHGLVNIVEERNRLRDALTKIRDEAVFVGEAVNPHLQFVDWCAYKAFEALNDTG